MVGCPGDEDDPSAADTDSPAPTAGSSVTNPAAGDDAGPTGAASSATSGADDGSGDGNDDSNGSDSATSGEPPSEPGVHSSTVSALPGGEPTACEWEWTVRTLHYHPSAVVPRRMYSASCDEGPSAKMFTSLTLGENAAHPEEDPSSGGIIISELDDATGTLSALDQRHFPECISMHGIAVSDDCQTIGALCRIPSGTDGFDVDVLATHPDADWMTQPHVCGDRGMNDEMWLYEWTNGDIQSPPTRYIVHKAIGSWEYGNNYLRLGDDDSTWGIAIKTTVGGAEGPDTCHEADAFLVMDRQSTTMTTRGWSWACGTGHTTFNRVAYDSNTGKYALLCSTDYNEGEVGGLGAFVFRMEDGPAQEIHYLNLDGIQNKGGASSIVARAGGGFLGVLVGVDGDIQSEGVPMAPPTAIGLAAFDGAGQMEGEIQWIVEDPSGYVGYSTLSELSPGRYLLGWGVMLRLDQPEDGAGDNALRVPWEYRVMEIDDQGTPLTEPLTVDGAGWGELDEMVPLGQGRAGWAYIADPALNESAEFPECNQPSLQLSVYTSPAG